MGCAYFEFDQLRSAGKFFEFLSKVTLTSRGGSVWLFGGTTKGNGHENGHRRNEHPFK